MLPTSWETIREAWPLIAGVALLWARLEVALSGARSQSEANAREIAKVEVKVEMMDRASQAQALQLARIETALTGVSSTLERLVRHMEQEGRK